MFEELLKRLAQALDLAAIPYMVFGGQAVLLYGEPRLTRDIDITLGTPPDHCGDVLAMVAQLGLHVLVEDAEKFVRETLVLPAMDVPSGIRIDFVFTFSEYERAAIARARTVLVDDVAVRFTAIEDLIVQKIVAGRPRDLDDVKAVVLKNPGFDRGYVEKWLGAFDQEADSRFLPLFQQVMAEIGEE